MKSYDDNSEPMSVENAYTELLQSFEEYVRQSERESRLTDICVGITLALGCGFINIVWVLCLLSALGVIK